MKTILAFLLVVIVGTNTAHGKTRIPAEFQFCFPYYKELQKGMSLSDYRKLLRTRDEKVNPFIYEVPKMRNNGTW